MTLREGSLEAPTRHPLDWKNADFWNDGALEKELERVFDICHGCRRCVSLCGAFPTLFDLIDNSSKMELNDVPKQRFKEVVDECYLCDMCFMTKCPYVPPHPWNVDFPHLMLRAKAVQFKKHGSKFSDRLLSSTDKLGLFAGIPIVTQAVNAMNRTKPVRAVLESQLGVDRTAWVPEYASRKFRSAAASNPSAPVRAGER